MTATVSSTRASVLGMRTYRWAAIALLYLLCSCSVVQLFWTEWSIDFTRNYSELAGVRGLIDGTAHRPFVYRRLTPELVKIGVFLARDVAGVSDVPEKLSASLMTQHHEWWGDHSNHLEHYVLYLLHLLSVFGTCWVWRALVRDERRFDPAFADAAPCIGMLVHPLTYEAHGLIYDFPDLFLSSLCLLLFMRSRYLLYYLAFGIAVFNKEAALLLIALVFARWVWSKQWRRALLHTAIHFAIFAAVHLPVRYAYANNPGQVPLLLMEHIKYLATLQPYVSVRLSYAAGFPVPGGMNIVLLLLLGASLFLCWDDKPPELRRSCIALVSVTFVAFLTGGFMNEIRVFIPCFSVFYLMGMYTLRSVTRQHAGT